MNPLFNGSKIKNQNIQLQKSKKCLFAFESPTPLSVIGEVDSALESTKITVAAIIVVKNARGCLPSGTTSIKLGFLLFTVHKDQPEAQEVNKFRLFLFPNVSYL